MKLRSLSRFLGTLILLQSLVDAREIGRLKRQDESEIPASAAKRTKLEQEITAEGGVRVQITFEGNPHRNGIEDVKSVETNGWRLEWPDVRTQRIDSATKRTFVFVIPKDYLKQKYTIRFGKEVHFFYISDPRFIGPGTRVAGTLIYLHERINALFPDPLKPAISQLLDALEARINDLSESGNQTHQRILWLEGEVVKIERVMNMKIENNTTSPEELAAVAEKLQNQLTALNGALNETILQVEDDVSQAKSELETKIDEAVKHTIEERTKLDKEIKRLENEFGIAHGKQLLNLTTQVADLNDKIVELSTIKTTIETQHNLYIKTLEQNRDKLDTHIKNDTATFEKIHLKMALITSTLNAEVSGFNASLESLQSKVGDGVKVAKDELQKKLEKLAAEGVAARRNLTAEISRLETEFGIPHKGEISELKEKVEALEGGNGDLERLNVTIEEHQKRFVQKTESNEEVIRTHIFLSAEEFENIYGKIKEMNQIQSARAAAFNSRMTALDSKVDKNENEADAALQLVTGESGKIAELEEKIKKQGEEIEALRTVVNEKADKEAFNKLKESSIQVEGKVNALDTGYSVLDSAVNTTILDVEELKKNLETTNTLAEDAKKIAEKAWDELNVFGRFRMSMGAGGAGGAGERKKA